MARNIQSLERAAAMLRLLAGGERRLGLSDVASSLGLAKGTAHGILSTAGSLGLMLGTKVKPFQVPLLFSLIVLPLTFLGCTYFPWQDLSRVAWLKWAVLANPVVYMTEGFRAALVGNIPHMPLYAIYGALTAFGALFTWIGVTGFEKRVFS